MAPEQSLSDRNWRPSLALLTEVAREGRVITYGELLDDLDSRGLPTPNGNVRGHRARNLRWTAGRIGTELSEMGNVKGGPVPPINALVVRDTIPPLPGDGCDDFTQQYWRAKRRPWPAPLSKRKRQSIYQRLFDEIWTYPYWNEVQRRLSVPTIKKPGTSSNPPIKPKVPRGGESPAHRRLKQAILADPALLRLGPGTIRYRKSEEFLWSGDSVDVLFKRRLADGNTEIVIVEVKVTSDERELTRGIYQCVKYAATIRAMLREDPSYAPPGQVRVRTILANGAYIAPEVRGHANRENVELRIVAQSS